MLQTLSEIRDSMDNITAAELTVEPVPKPVAGESPSPPKQARAKTRSQSKSAHQGPLTEGSAPPQEIARVKTRSMSKQAEVLPAEGTDSTNPPPKRTKPRKTTLQEPLRGGAPRSDSNRDRKGKSKEPFTPFPVTNLLGASIPSREPPSSVDCAPKSPYQEKRKEPARRPSHTSQGSREPHPQIFPAQHACCYQR
ncbi:hypothetical protein DFP72DRAFT_337840 [Ephemerocybe angulata]|uniref:Uncharacterized protein n=1 Tax=Ephemerocybe angulata TaxID=980116 RepID=A0A8H6IGL6_9AGAR|nr:hypothetical protein DFP72DRAFT_337840 [Tulosesus angulatus]